MKILVTGGNGFIGSALVKKLVKQGHTVSVIDRNVDIIKSLKAYEGDVHFYHQDLSTMTSEDFNNHIGNDVGLVYHIAAEARIQPSFKNPVSYFKSNCNGTLNVAHWCATYNIPIVYAGSSSTHSGKFKNPYTFTKTIGEEILELYKKHYNLRFTTARFYNVYGPGHLKTGDFCTLIGIWETCIENNLPLTIYGDGSKTRDFTHVFDIVSALTKMKGISHIGDYYELGRGNSYSIKEIAEMFDPKQGIEYKPDRQGEADHTLCDTSLAKKKLNWNPTLNLPDYIEKWKKSIKIS